MAGGSRRKKRISTRTIIFLALAVCFLTAGIIYFVNSFISTEYENAVYSTMEDPELPVVYVISGEQRINPMRGHFQDMENEAADTVSVLPENRKLEISIAKYGNSITGIRYEIRNLSRDHFIEKTEVTDFTEDKDTVTAVLPIQNLIDKDTHYLLSITVDTGEKSIHYYTKILWTDPKMANDMVQLACDFHRKSFNYEEARDLTQYLETDPKADNDDFGTVTVGSSFSQLTWGETGMMPDSEPEIYLREVEGITGSVEVQYRTRMDSPAGAEEFVNIDGLTMRSGAERLYVMNFERKTYEIFSGSKHRFTGKKIMLGITNPERLSTMTDAQNRFVVFKTDRELWSFDQETQTAVNIFSFRSRNDDGVRSGCRDHDLKILSVGEDGTVDFVVYGYMNRGLHEGYCGLVYYSYSPATNSMTEKFFAPFARSCEKIGEELSSLCTKGGSDMFFFRQNNILAAVDLKSLEMMEIVSGITDGTFAADAAQSSFAWVEEGKYTSPEVKVMDVTQGSTKTVHTENGDTLRILTYNGNDLVLGRARTNDIWYIGKRIKSQPMYKLEIYDRDLNCIMEYGRNNRYVDNFTKNGSRFLFDLLIKTGSGTFEKESTDTIVCSEEEETGRENRCLSTTSSEKKKVWYVAIDQEIKNTKHLKVKVPESISYENSGNVEIRETGSQKAVRYFAYINGRLQGGSESFREAMDRCYDGMGWITDQNGAVLFSRTNKGAYHTISEPFRKAQPLLNSISAFEKDKLTGDGYLIIDAYGIPLDRLLPFVYNDYPVAFLTKDGETALIYGFDQSKIKIYHPDKGEGSSTTETMDRDAAAAYFAENGNNFLCFTAAGV